MGQWKRVEWSLEWQVRFKIFLLFKWSKLTVLFNFRSAEWASVSSADKKRLGLSIASDGEFWMSFEDFKRYFDDVEVTNLSPDQLEDKISTRRWEEKCFEGQWVSGVSAGGSRKFRDTFFINPQYIVTLNDPDEDDDDDLCTFVVSVMQEYTRKKGLENLKIGFSIYKVKESLAVRLVMWKLLVNITKICFFFFTQANQSLALKFLMPSFSDKTI